MALASTINLGSIDRIIRGLLGTMILQNALSSRMFKLWKMATAVGLIYTALKGMCPIMKELGISTVPGQENNLLNQLKQAFPGQGINPIQTEQPKPQNNSQAVNKEKPLAKALVIE
jgi:hypothetical protein